MASTTRDWLSPQLNSWLVSLQLPPRNGQGNTTSNELQNGQLVSDIVKLLHPESGSFELGNGSTVMTRQSNWNTLTEPLGQMGIKLTPQEKTRLVNGDRDQLINLLEKLRMYSLKQRREAEVDITKLDAKKELRSSSSLLEMLLLVLMRNFNLSSKECVTLLSSQGKYLAHILAKGLKGEFAPVQSVYLELNKNVSLLTALSKDKESKQFLFKALKPGVISKSERVAFSSFELLASFLKSVPQGLETFKQLFAGSAFLGVRRHKTIVAKVIKLLVDLTNFGTDTLDIIKEFADDEDLLTCYIEVYELAQERDKLAQAQQMVGWQQLVSTTMDAGSRWTNRQQWQCLQFIHLLVRGGSKTFQENNPVKLFAALCESRSKVPGQAAKVHTMTFLFECLAEFGRTKNSLAPAVYKQIIGLLPEILLSEESQLYFLNLCTIVEQFPKIPLGMLLQSFANGYSQNEQGVEINEFHIKLLSMVADSEELELKNTLLLLDICTKMQLNNAVFASQITTLICKIVNKVADQEIVQELLNKFIKISLAIYYANEKKKEPKRKSLVPGKNKESAAEVLIRLKNIVIYHTLDKLLGMKLPINEPALPLIGFTIVQLRTMGPDRSELLMKLLGHYGNPEEVIKEFEPQQQIPEPNDEYQVDKRIKPQSTARFNNVTPKVLQGLQKYHNSYIKKVEKVEALEKQKQQEAQRRIQLKKSMELKMLQQGLTLRSDQQIQLLFDFDSREKVLKLEKPHKNNEVTYFDIDFEEDRDIRAIDYLQKKYHKAIRYMYVRYSNSIGDVKTGKDFDEFAQKTQSIKAVDVWKLFKEHSLDDYITIFECQEMVKLVNYRSGNKNDPLVLDFAGFERCLLQLAVFMYSRPPKDLRVNPPALLYEEMFRMMRAQCEKTGINPQLFDDPDTAYFSQGQVIRQLNRKLAENPNHILPEGYKKIVEKKVDFEYNLCLDAIGTAYKDVYQIIDELLFDQFNFHILQPFTKVSTKAKARPALFYVNEKRQDDLGRSQERLHIRSELEKTKLSQTLRNELARYPMKERSIATKVAAVFEDILVAVELGHDQIGMKLQNTAIKSKKEREQEERKLKQTQVHKRKQRQEQLKKQLEQVKDKRTQKQRLEEERKQKEEQKRKEEEQKRKQKQKQLKNKLAEYQSKKKEDEQREKKEAEQKKQKEKEQEARKKRQAEQAKRKIQEAKKKKQQEEQQKKQEEDKEKKKKKAYEEKLFKQKQKQLKEKIKEYKSSKGESKPEEKKQTEKEEVKALDS